MINFAVVGIGHISAKHIQAIQNADGANLYAICDTNEDRLKSVEIDNIVKHTDLEKLLTEHPEIDVVNICVPSGLHKTLAEIAAKHKKHIVLEKPMALTAAESREVMEAADQNGVKLAVVHPNRFRPAIRTLREKFDKGSFGKVSHANATVRWNRNQEYYDQAPWRGTKKYDGGVLMNQAIHNLDLLLWFMGPVESVKGMAATRLRKIETEDVAGALVTFESGAVAIIEAATTIYPSNLEESLSIFGETGTAKISGRNALHIDTWDFADSDENEKQRLSDEINENPMGKPGHDWIIQDMVEAINENREPIVNGQDGLAPVELIEAILQSAETGKEIFLSKEKQS
ncbi:Gfo/Idh/MocA family protein [Jeotgalibacillus sp. R-1-5s-1]|uniref:Gfo/Idh/MocA family protein n=1 Tax=Jeotgalibacillus sp. R-1-5s-1 TaxID=2555897 RepID=UPI00106A2EA7|nr:Gfo/Idh/MocA family oxidoreductase [Jeotgalibacillus sp. R-1-5s-1]TFD95753.1 Gfo/Idh/MocA family oxidoreductase [Jeotgalibacillus sp. R-1-5s-1]